jgi:hypothetical protein
LDDGAQTLGLLVEKIFKLLLVKIFEHDIFLLLVHGGIEVEGGDLPFRGVFAEFV